MNCFEGENVANVDCKGVFVTASDIIEIFDAGHLQSFPSASSKSLSSLPLSQTHSHSPSSQTFALSCFSLILSLSLSGVFVGLAHPCNVSLAEGAYSLSRSPSLSLAPTH